MLVTYKNLSRIKFPIYKLTSNGWYFRDGLVFFNGKVLDDRNMPGETLGQRRLLTPMKPLHKLRKMATSVPELLSFKHFIDFSGNLFTYEKTKYQALRYLKIKKVDLLGVSSLVWVDGVSYPFEVPRPPPYGSVYAGILFYEGIPWLIYDFSANARDPTRRMV